MTLRDYLIREGLTFTAFAKTIGTRHARTVERYVKGQTIPDRVMMARIVDVTAGEVTPNDFFAVSDMVIGSHELTSTAGHPAPETGNIEKISHADASA